MEEKENATELKKLRIGFWFSDGWFTCTDCVKRAITEALDILRDVYNYEIVEIPFNRGQHVIKLYLRYMVAEGNLKEFVRNLRGESLHETYQLFKMYYDIPNFVKKYIICPLLRSSLVNDHRKAFVMECAAKNGGYTLREYKFGFSLFCTLCNIVCNIFMFF